MTSNKSKAICWLITNVDVAASCINWLLAGCSNQGIHLSIRWGRHYMLGGRGQSWNMGWEGGTGIREYGLGVHTGVLE
jgi:hypothetical protein